MSRKESVYSLSPKDSQDKTQESCEKSSIPEDHYGKVFWIVFIVGMICVMPWNILVTVDGYWEYKFRNQSVDYVDTSSQELTKEQEEFETYLTIVSSATSCLSVITHAIVGYRFSVNKRSIVSLSGIIAMFVGIVTLAYVDSDDWTTTFMVVNLVLAGIVNAFRAWLRATSSSNLAKFPVKYTGSLSNGLTVGGLIPVLLNITILSMDVEEQMAGFGCFLYALIVAVICLVAFLHMKNLEYYKHYTHIESSAKLNGKRASWNREVLLLILSRIWRYALTLVISVVTTVAIYPGAGSLIEPVNPSGSDWHQVYFTQVTFFLTLNVFSVSGTLLAGYFRWPNGTSKTNQYLLLSAAVLRAGLVPLLMMCNLAPNNRSHDVLIASDAAFVALVAAFGLADGYIVNMALMFGPKTLDDGTRELGTALLIVFNASSAPIGALLGNVVVNAL